MNDEYLPPTPKRTPRADLTLIHDRLDRWRKYTFGTNENTRAVAFASHGVDGRWKVFVTFAAQPLTVAYVTLADVSDPVMPAPHVVSWYYSGLTDLTINALLRVVPDNYSRTPVPLPENHRPPRMRPVTIRLEQVTTNGSSR